MGNVTQEYLLSVSFGGVILGFGVGLVIRYNGCLDGTETILEVEGLISGSKVVLYCVLTRLEIYQLKQVINSVDGSTFTTISDVSEIIGNHIKKLNS